MPTTLLATIVELWRTIVAITLLAVLQSLASKISLPKLNDVSLIILIALTLSAFHYIVIVLHDIQRRLASQSGWRGCRRDLMRAGK
jgi:hypothetical protein